MVHNGPGIVVSGLRPHSIRRGKVRFTVDAFSADDPFDPRRAEARSSIPVWVWVMSLFVVAWAVWYAARMWDVPAEFAHSPTYSSQNSSGSPSAASRSDFRCFGAQSMRITVEWKATMTMDDIAVARALHVLAVVIWIGGVSMATTVMLPAIRRGDLGAGSSTRV